jgi:hypothetical protein
MHTILAQSTLVANLIDDSIDARGYSDKITPDKKNTLAGPTLMDWTRWLPFTSTVVSVVFAIAVLVRYRRRRGLYLLFWGLGLILYSLGTFAELYSTFAWSALVFRLWYIGGALLTAAWLGQGTVYLLVRRRNWAHFLMIGLMVASALAVIVMFATPLDASAFDPSEALSAQYKHIMPSDALVRRLTPLFNVYGTVWLVGGAVYSAWIFWRKRILLHRVVGNVLIALGALAPAIGGSLSRLGTSEFLYVSELLGAVLMFLGFIRATTPMASEEALSSSPREAYP